MASELIEHFKVDAQFHKDHTLQTSYISDPARGLRRERIEKRWYREKHIGHGSFGTVVLEVERDRDRVNALRAVKILQKSRMHAVKIDYERELLALAKLSKYQEAFVTLQEWYENDEHVFIAMEYFSLGDLEKYITVGITEVGARSICSQLLGGLNIMHMIGLTHRDLKPQNIFVVSQSPNWWIKIGDFGVTKRTGIDHTALRTQVGTQLFQAPEILGFIEELEETSEYTNAVDMWSLGCVTYLMLARCMPFARQKAVYDFCSGRIPFPSGKLRENDISQAAVHFLEGLMVPNPSKRPSAELASRNDWVKTCLSTETNVDGICGSNRDHEAFKDPKVLTQMSTMIPGQSTPKEIQVWRYSPLNNGVALLGKEILLPTQRSPVPAIGHDTPKKRGRPAKYASKKEKSQEEVRKRREKRQAQSAARRNLQFDRYYASSQRTKTGI